MRRNKRKNLSAKRNPDKSFNKLAQVRNVFENAALLLSSILFILLALEASYRLLWQSDFERWIAGPAASSQKWIYAHSEGHALFRHLFLNYEPDKVNIWGVGDSFTYGEGVFDVNEIYLEKLSKRFNDKFPVEIVHMGKGGFNAQDILNLLKRPPREFRQDIILYGLNLNDILTPEIQLGFEGRKTLSSRFQWLTRRSYLFFDVMWRMDRIMENYLGNSYVDVLARQYEEKGAGWKQFVDTINAMKQFAENNGADFLVAILPMFVGFDDYPFRAAHEMLMNFCKGNSIDCVDILPQFSGKTASDYWVNPYDTHPNAAAHTIIADGIFPELSKLAEKKYGDITKQPRKGQKLSIELYIIRSDSNLTYNWDRAVNYQRSRILEEPDNPLYHFNLASVYFACTKMDSAEIMLNESLRLQPDFSMAKNLLGLLIPVHFNRKEYEEAINFCNKLISMDSTNITALGYLGDSYYCMSEFKKAVDVYLRAILYYPDHAEFHSNLIGIFMYNLRDYQKALNQIKIAEKMGHGNFKAIKKMKTQLINLLNQDRK